MKTVLPFAPPTKKSSSVKRVERRNWQRVHLRLPMIFLNERREEHKGVTIDISGGGLLFHTQTPPFRGERVICYVEQIGRMSGHVIRSSAGLVAITSDAPFTKRDRMADHLTWISNKDRLNLTDERRASRSEGDTAVLVHTANGRELRCIVIDMSFVGVALATSDQRPLIGERVQVGPQQGRVARYLPEGFAVDLTRI